MPHKIGLHILSSPPQSEIVALCKRLQPAVIKALDNGSYLAEIADALKSELDYTPVFVSRFWWGDASNVYQGQTFSQWHSIVESFLQPVRNRDNFYVESYNETGVSLAYLKFEADRAKRLREDYGVRAAVGNLAVGWSTPGHFDMANEAGLLAALRAYGGAWQEHGYSGVLGLQLWHGPLNQSIAADGTLGRSPQEMAFDKTIWPDTVASWLAFRVSMSHQSMKALGYGDIPIILSEFGFDDAGYPSYDTYTSGAHVDGWRNARFWWNILGYLEGRSDAQFYGEQLAWAEAQMAVYPWLLGATIFTYGSNPADRWALYDVRPYGVYDEFLIAVAAFEPQEPPPQPEPVPQPELPALGCWIAAWPENVNIREAADTTSKQIGLIPAGEIREAAGYVLQNGDPARRWYQLKDGGYVAAWVVLATDECEPIPPDEDENGEDEIVSNLMGLVIRKTPAVGNLQTMMDALKPSYCTVVIQAGEAAYIQLLAETFPDTEFGVVFDFSLDFGFGNPATPTNFGPLRQSATTEEGGSENYNPNRAWLNWINTASANGHKLHDDFVHLGALPEALRSRIRIISFWEYKLDADYVSFEKERMAQLWFEPYFLKSIILNNRGEHMERSTFELLQAQGIRFPIEKYDGAVGRIDSAGAFLELWHGEAQSVDGDNNQWDLLKHPREFINKLPVYEAGRFHPDSGDLGSYLAFRVLREHHWYNEFVPDNVHAGGVPLYITAFGYRGDSGRVAYQKYYDNLKALDGYQDNVRVWQEWGIVNTETALKEQLEYARAQIGKVPQVRGFAFDNVFSGGPRDISAVAFYDAVDPEEPPPPPEPEPEPGSVIATFTVSGTHIVGQYLNCLADAPRRGHSFEWTINDAVQPTITRLLKFIPDKAGGYTVTLKVTRAGVSATSTRDITVNSGSEPPPPVEPSGELVLDWLHVELAAAKERVRLLEQLVASRA